MSGRGNGGEAALPQSRPTRAAAERAKKELPNAVKRMEAADRKEKQAQSKNKKKKRATSKGRGTAKQNNGRKGGRSGGNGDNKHDHKISVEPMAARDRAFPGHGQRLDSEPSAVAVAKKAGATRLIGASINSNIAKTAVDGYVSTFMNMEHHKALVDSLKRDVAKLNEANTNNQKLNSLFFGDVEIAEVRGGTKLEGGIMLGVKEDYEHVAHNDTSDTIEDWKICTATYTASNIRGREAVEVFRLCPVDYLRGAISDWFEHGDHLILSDESFPSYKDLFWSIGYHYVLQRDDFEPDKLVDIFKEMWPEKDWNIVASLNERNAKKKKVKYTG